MSVERYVAEVEAIQNTGWNAADIIEWSGGAARNAKPWKENYSVVVVATPDGDEDAYTGCWVVRNTSGHFSVWSDSVFSAYFGGAVPVQEPTCTICHYTREIPGWKPCSIASPPCPVCAVPNPESSPQ